MVIIAQDGGQGPDKPKTKQKKKKKKHFGGEGAPKGLVWGDLMAPQPKFLKTWILRSFKLFFVANYDVDVVVDFLMV